MQLTTPIVHPYSRFQELDIYLFKEGNHFQLFEKFGAHLTEMNGVSGVYFAVWAPSAVRVTVIGNFNGWNRYAHPLYVRWDSSGIWEGFIPGVQQGDYYKYALTSTEGEELEKGDPFAFFWETPERTASIVWDLSYQWNEGNWPELRAEKNSLQAPISIYELHCGSWKHREGTFYGLTFREMAATLPSYLKEMGFTHVEFMPPMEHPFYGSWGYQKTGYFAPSSRFGTPQDFMHLIEKLHQEGIGVFLDWVPSHFPGDAHGLFRFDGTHLYEHADPRKGYHPDWGSYIFNYSRSEVRSFLFSSAFFWLHHYRADGLRVDAVSSMLYLDYSRKKDEWIPNERGGHENLEAISFLKHLNERLYASFPHIQMIAEESTAWPMVSRPTSQGGLGFGMKWNMGWMHDTLSYFRKEPIHRKHHHNNLLFNLYYFYNENFLLSLSHDEVVYGKGSLLSKMPGDEWQQFANLRLLYTYMFAHPGKKLLFMGAELATRQEWNHDSSLDWGLLSSPLHQGIHQLLIDLNHLYQREKALYELDYDYRGFEWIQLHDRENSVIAFLRKSSSGEMVLAVYNFTPVPRPDYLLHLPCVSNWNEIFNSDDVLYGGSGLWKSAPQEKSAHLFVDIPPLGGLLLRSS